MNILVIMPMEPGDRARLAAAVPGTELTFVGMKKVTDQQIARADAIIGNLPPERLKHAVNLNWLQLSSSGADKYCAPGLLPAGTVLTNATGAYGPAISEYMIGVVFALAYNLHKYRDNQKNRLWRDEGPVRPIADSTVLVVGLGDIGRAFASRIKAMGCHVIGVKRTPSEKPDYVDELYLMDSLDTLLKRADVVTLSLPRAPETDGLMDEARLLAMKKDAILVNVGRGSAVRTEDLCRVLASGHLKGCALDVTDPEPLPPEHPLWAFDRVMITPHISGGNNVRETVERVQAVVTRNLRAYVSGKPLENLVDFHTGYKAH